MEGRGDRTAGDGTKWYWSKSFVVIALLCVGPLALPLVWFNPRYGPVMKLFISLLVIVATVLLCVAMQRLYVLLVRQIREICVMMAS